MRILEVTQDGAGIISTHNDEGDGLYTEGVESCIVYAFYGESALCIIHDTGQLSIPSIRSIAARCGTINNVYCAQNSLKASLRQNKLHRERKKKIFSLLKYSAPEHEVDIQNGGIAFMKDGRILLNAMEISGVERLPDKVIRHCLNLMNNLFSRKNSQSIPVDVQYELGEYTDAPNLRQTFTAMQDRAQKEALNNRDQDYLRVLETAKRLGIV